MFWGLVSTILDAVASITRKKSLEICHTLSAYGFKILGLFGPIIFVPLFFITHQYSFQKLSIISILGVLGICILRIIGTNLGQYIYKNEKLSVLMPYENLNKVFTLIASFVILSDGNIVTLGACFGVIFLLILKSVDFRSFTVPHLFGLVFLHEILTSARSFFTAYVIKHLLPFVDYFIIESFLILGFLVIGVVYYKDFKVFKHLPANFYSYRLTSGLIGTSSYVIGLYLISSIGLIATILLSFLGIIVKLALSSIILREKFSHKDTLFALCIGALVGIGFIYK